VPLATNTPVALAITVDCVIRTAVAGGLAEREHIGRDAGGEEGDPGVWTPITTSP
jgi:hypothetical protein